jgi:hypothetical protein
MLAIVLHASSRVLRVFFLCGLTSVGLYGGASCSSGADATGASTTGAATTTGGAGDAAAPDVVVYEGDANDEALAALMAIQGPQNPMTYAVFDAPAEGTVLPASPAPTFTWHLKTTPPPSDAGTDSGAFLLRPAAPARFASLGPLLDLFGKERAAQAHGAPLSGLGYLILFTTETNNDLLRVFTSKTTYTPGPGAMEIFKGVKGLIQAWILTGVFDNNALTPDGGPFRGPWTSFEIEG